MKRKIGGIIKENIIMEYQDAFTPRNENQQIADLVCFKEFVF